MKFTLIFAIILCFSTTISYGQHEVHRHQFGILAGGILVEQIGLLPNNSTPTPYEEETGTGFSLGILYQYQINHLIAIRPQAMINFRETAHYNESSQRADFNTSFVHTAFPLHAIFSAYGWKLEPYLAVGGRYELEIAEERDNDLPKLNKNNTFAIDVGFGLTFNAAKFSFRPEILGSWGANNIVDVPNFRGDVRRNTLEIRLLFQGNALK